MRGNMMFALAMLAVSLPAAAGQPIHATTGQIEARNKQVVLAMWHDVIDGRNIANAPRYIAEGYIQHSPSAGQGRAALMAFLKHEFGNAPARAQGRYPLTRFEFVIAEGDLVQLMFQRQMPDEQNPAKTIPVWWYDTYRVKGGRIVEHWDSALR